MTGLYDYHILVTILSFEGLEYNRYKSSNHPDAKGKGNGYLWKSFQTTH